MDYEKMLDSGIKEIPEEMIHKSRFEVPKAKGHIQGNTTVINNFYQVVADLGRPKEHLMKFLLKELATRGDLTDKALLLKRKVNGVAVNEKIKKYAEEYVICPECGKPDTKIIKEGAITFMRCMACGSKHTLKNY
ncbi:MAG: translation initiation factor IF-2 subunit beta [Nanoarchaeota archaeon]|nr:translation initiation factor IF-2 subunit beta [Nanoarchaeota archaeon]